MIKRYYRSVFDELEDMRKYLDVLNRQIYGTSPAALLPAAGGSEVKMLPAQQTIHQITVFEDENEVVITARMIAGITKKEIVLELINPRVLEITGERMDATTHKNGRYYPREHRIKSITRIVPLPEPVTDEGSSATFRNGVLEVHLKKIAKGSQGKIPVD